MSVPGAAGAGKGRGQRGSAYAGKHYEDRTEVTSTAPEKLMDDPAGLAHNDPEMAKSLLGVLGGSLR